MTKLYFYDNDLKYRAIPNLSNASNKVNNAYRIMLNLSIPQTFAYCTKLLEFTSELNSYISNINYAEEWLQLCCNKYSTLEDKEKATINMIPKENFKTRESIVRKNLS